jgi:hypothetical protein
MHLERGQAPVPASASNTRSGPQRTTVAPVAQSAGAQLRNREHKDVLEEVVCRRDVASGGAAQGRAHRLLETADELLFGARLALPYAQGEVAGNMGMRLGERDRSVEHETAPRSHLGASRGGAPEMSNARARM